MIANLFAKPKLETISLDQYINADIWFEKRKDYKFLIPNNKINDIVNDLKHDYLCVENKNKYHFQYTNHYLDTKDFALFNQHRKQQANRIKIRERHYHQNNAKFLELKVKSKYGYTTKLRESLNTVNKNNFDFIHQALYSHNLNYNDLQKSLSIQYNRIVLLKKDNTQRISIDFDLNTYDSKYTKNLLPKHCVLEIKSIKYPKKTIKLLYKHKIKQTPFSKYCIAICLLKENIKTNFWHNTIKNYCL